MEHSLIIELAACLFCFRWNCVHKEDRWTWCGICMASPRRVWERRSLGAKPAGLGSAATEIKLLGNMQLRPGSIPSLSLRHFPSTKGLDFSAVWCILHPDRYLRKNTFLSNCLHNSKRMCMVVSLQSGAARRVITKSRTFVICSSGSSETSTFTSN